MLDVVASERPAFELVLVGLASSPQGSLVVILKDQAVDMMTRVLLMMSSGGLEEANAIWAVQGERREDSWFAGLEREVDDGYHLETFGEEI